MSGGEERIFYSFLSLIIFTFAIGFFGGYLLQEKIESSTYKDESFFQEQASQLYTMSMDYMSEIDPVKKEKILERIKGKVKYYNSYSKSIKHWNYHCKQTFTVEYLLGEWLD